MPPAPENNAPGRSPATTTTTTVPTAATTTAATTIAGTTTTGTTTAATTTAATAIAATTATETVAATTATVATTTATETASVAPSTTITPATTTAATTTTTASAPPAFAPSSESKDSMPSNFYSTFPKCEGIVLPVAADGHCLYHVAVTALLLKEHKNFLRNNNGFPVCVPLAANVMRQKAKEAWDAWAQTCSQAQLQENCMRLWGESPERVGSSYLGGIHGSAVDLALVLAKEKIGVVVVQRERPNSIEEGYIREFVTDVKHVICVVQTGAHWDLAAIKFQKEGAECNQALFKLEYVAMYAIAKFLCNLPCQTLFGPGVWKPPPLSGVLLFLLSLLFLIRDLVMPNTVGCLRLHPKLGFTDGYLFAL